MISGLGFVGLFDHEVMIEEKLYFLSIPQVQKSEKWLWEDEEVDVDGEKTAI